MVKLHIKSVPLGGRRCRYRPGSLVEVEEQEAQDLVKRGFAEYVTEGYEVAAFSAPTEQAAVKSNPRRRGSQEAREG